MATNENGFTEAPASFTVKAFKAGFECRLTIRAADTKAIVKSIPGALTWLEDQGFTPYPQPQAAAPAGPNAADGHETAWCPIHQCSMQRREKNGESWYSHKATREDGKEYWCRGKANNS